MDVSVCFVVAFVSVSYPLLKSTPSMISNYIPDKQLSKKGKKKVKRKDTKNTVVVLRSQPAVVQRSQVSGSRGSREAIPFVIANPLSKRMLRDQPADRADTHIWAGPDDTHPDKHHNYSQLNGAAAQKSNQSKSERGHGGLQEVHLEVQYDPALLQLVKDIDPETFKR